MYMKSQICDAPTSRYPLTPCHTLNIPNTLSLHFLFGRLSVYAYTASTHETPINVRKNATNSSCVGCPRSPASCISTGGCGGERGSTGFSASLVNISLCDTSAASSTPNIGSSMPAACTNSTAVSKSAWVFQSASVSTSQPRIRTTRAPANDFVAASAAALCWTARSTSWKLTAASCRAMSGFVEATSSRKSVSSSIVVGSNMARRSNRSSSSLASSGF